MHDAQMYLIVIRMVRLSSILTLAGVLASCGLVHAGTLSIGSSVTSTGPSTVPYATAYAQADHPTGHDSFNTTHRIVVAYTTSDANDKPPTSVTVSYALKMSGSYEYVLFGSTTTHYSVSASFSGNLTLNGIPMGHGATVSGDSGTIDQTAQEQSNRASDTFLIDAQGATFTPNWTRSFANNTYTYTYTCLTATSNGHVDATALGWSAPPHPPGTSPAIPPDFSSISHVLTEFGPFSLGSNGGTNPPGGGGGGQPSGGGA